MRDAGKDRVDGASSPSVSWGMGRQVKVWAVALLLVVLFGLFTVTSLLSGRSRSAQRTVMERWAETIGTPDDVFAQHPTREMNPRALDLIDATLVFGVDSAPRDDKGMPRPERASTKRFKQFKAQNSRWLNNQLSKTSGPPDPPPEPVLAFLAEFRGDIDLVQGVLVGDAKPIWMRDLTLLYNAPIPNLLGHIDLNKLLLSDSLAALSAGDIGRAERALEAAWQLAELLADDPTLISQFVRLDMLRAQAAAVRQMPWLDEWIPRLSTTDLRKSIEQSLFYEGWLWPQYDYGPGEKADILARVFQTINGPFMRLGSADASERWRRTIVKLQETPAWCRPALERLGVRLEIPVPWWNKFGAIMISDVDRTVERVAQAQLQFELTRKLLELAATRAETGNWPVGSEPWLRSTACPLDRWIYSVEGSSASLRLDRVVETSDGGTLLAWEFSLDADVAWPVRRKPSTVSSTSGESMMNVWPRETTSESP